MKRKPTVYADQNEIIGEEWKQVYWKGIIFENYECSNLGRIKNTITRKILKQRVKYDGRMKTCLTKDKTYYPNVHRVIAETWIPNPENKREVNHINGDYTDNKIENLEWNTSLENHLHAVENNLINKKTPIRKIIFIEENKIFNSVTECARYFLDYIEPNRTIVGLKRGISNAAKGITKCYLGKYNFAYLENSPN